MTMARMAFQWLVWLMVIGVGIQFFLAGLGVFGGESIEAHRQWGFAVLHIIPILMFVAAIVGKMGRMYIGMTVVLFLLVFFQVLWADPEFDPEVLRSLHVFNAFLIAGLTQHLAMRVGQPFGAMKSAT